MKSKICLHKDRRVIDVAMCRPREISRETERTFSLSFTIGTDEIREVTWTSQDTLRQFLDWLVYEPDNPGLGEFWLTTIIRHNSATRRGPPV
jgi:hypothetical protein